MGWGGFRTGRIGPAERPPMTRRRGEADMADDTITFAAVGDIDLSRWGAQAVARGGADWPFAEMMPVLRQADLLFGNMESVVLPEDYPDGQIDPKGLVDKFDATAALAEAGFDFLNLAQNHILDGGQVGMFHTQRLIEALGIATAGVGRTQAEARRMRVLQAGGLTVGFLCYCEDSNYTLSTTGPCHAYYVPEDVLADVAEVAGRVDALVVSIHADLEFMATPSVPRREAFRKIAAAGATMVLGHHPHVPQGVELIDGCLIAYSLGNFYFPAHSSEYMKGHQPHTARSFVLLAEVSRDGVHSFRREPFEIQPPPNERPVPLTGPAREEMIAYLEELDRMVADDEIVRTNWRRIALEHLDIYLQRIKQKDSEEVLADLLGRLLLVAENRNWVEEVFAAVKENWAHQAAQVDPLHRPHYVLRSRFEAQNG